MGMDRSPAGLRQRILDAGVTLVRRAREEGDGAVVLPWVRPVCQEAGLSTSSFVDAFADVAAYRRALLDALRAAGIEWVDDGDGNPGSADD